MIDRFIDLFRRRRLHENAVDRRVAIQLLDSREEIVLGRLGGQFEFYRMQPEFAAHLVLRSDIGARSGIVADQNDRESGGNTFDFSVCNFAAQLGIDFFRNRAAVDQLGRCPRQASSSGAQASSHMSIGEARRRTFGGCRWQRRSERARFAVATLGRLSGR